MITKDTFVPGRMYSVIYSSDVNMVSKRDGKLNPIDGTNVTVRRVSTIQAAGNKTWTNYKAKHGIVTGTRPDWWTVSPVNSCIVIGNTDNTRGVEYLRGLPKGITTQVYSINGTVATPAQVETIKAFKRNQGDTDFIILSLAKLENVDSGTGDAE